jgi:hypothetical protein
VFYAAFEAKQTINSDLVGYAQKKIASVRRLHRTSLPIPHAGGTYPPKPLPQVFGGLLTFESEWSPALGAPLLDVLGHEEMEGRLDTSAAWLLMGGSAATQVAATQ